MDSRSCPSIFLLISSMINLRHSTSSLARNSSDFSLSISFFCSSCNYSSLFFCCMIESRASRTSFNSLPAFVICSSRSACALESSSLPVLISCCRVFSYSRAPALNSSSSFFASSSLSRNIFSIFAISCSPRLMDASRSLIDSRRLYVAVSFSMKRALSASYCS